MGTNTISIAVIDNGGTAASNATITATRSGSAALANFTVNPGTINPAFSSSNYNYSTTLPAGTGAISVTPTAIDSTATITVNGKGVATGTASPNIQLAVGSNTITTVVTTADGTASQTYTLIVTRPSADAYLSVLHLSAGALSPSFVSTTYNYSVAVANTVASIILTPTAQDPGARVTINGTAVTSGTASAPINLNEGANTITIVVTAADGVTAKTYTLTVTRAGNNNDNLSSMQKLSTRTVLYRRHLHRQPPVMP